MWSADFTYLPRLRGLIYLVAILDWFSRYGVAWQLSNALDGLFCLEALRTALQQGQPEIFNTDQDVQFTALDLTQTLEQAGIRISMDGRGRALDNTFVERLYFSKLCLDEGVHRIYTRISLISIIRIVITRCAKK